MLLKNICKILVTGFEKQAYNPYITSLAHRGVYKYMFCSFKATQTGVVNLQKFIRSESTIKKLNEKGIQAFFPIQAQTFQHIYQGRDMIAGDKTGSGKTLAFTLPVIQKMRDEDLFRTRRGIKFVVLAPTRELAVQIGNEIDSLK